MAELLLVINDCLLQPMLHVNHLLQFADITDPLSSVALFSRFYSHRI